ncbi:hypothetical protein E2C01_093118 [Portunus trituberculatus]|uniref:Uncharacterized protein n=1 Tax=Portunus trituberculatus TaxID=210409 RepID=A0A5B7JU10_PORTR|nr:hypothetical protein [Portunus trituberculatus]
MKTVSWGRRRRDDGGSGGNSANGGSGGSSGSGGSGSDVHLHIIPGGVKGPPVSDGRQEWKWNYIL